MELSSIERDVDAIEQGTWVSDIPGMGSLRLRVRGQASDLYQETLNKHQRAVGREERRPDGTLLPKAAFRVLGLTLNEAVLLEWDGLTEGGNLLQYNAPKALQILTDPRYRIFADAVIYAANYVDGMKARVTEETAKNLVPPSSEGSAENTADHQT